MTEGFEQLKRKPLLEHFSEVEDFRAHWRVMYPIVEVFYRDHPVRTTTAMA